MPQQAARYAIVSLVLIVAAGARAQTSLPSGDAAKAPPPDERAHPIVNGRQIQPHAGQPPSAQEQQQINQVLQQIPNDPAANGPIVPPHDLYGNSLAGSPSPTTKQP